jgi:hypothetical protein
MTLGSRTKNDCLNVVKETLYGIILHEIFLIIIALFKIPSKTAV